MADPQFIMKYTSKPAGQGLDLINDYGLEEMDVTQEPNLQLQRVKGFHGAFVTAGALGAKVLSLRGAIEEESVQLCYFKMNRLSAHLKLLVPSKLWVWDDRFLWTIGGDITWKFIPAEAGYSTTWTAQVIAMDPYWQDKPAGEQDPDGFVTKNPGSTRSYVNKGNAPTYPVFIVKAIADKIEDFITIKNESMSPEWVFHIGIGRTRLWPTHNYISNFRLGDVYIIDGFTRQVTHIPTWGPHKGRRVNVSNAASAGDYIWLEGGANGKTNTLRFTHGGNANGKASVLTVWANKWY